MTNHKNNPMDIDDELDDELDLVSSQPEEIEDDLDEEDEGIKSSTPVELNDDLEDEDEEPKSESNEPEDLDDELDEDAGSDIVIENKNDENAFDNAVVGFQLSQFLKIQEIEDNLDDDEIDEIEELTDELEDEETKEQQVTKVTPQDTKLRRLVRHRGLPTVLETAIERVQETFKEADKRISSYGGSVDLGIRVATSSNRELASKFRFNGMPKYLNENLPSILGYFQALKGAGKEIDINIFLKTPLVKIIKRETPYSNVSLNELMNNDFEETSIINLLNSIKSSIDFNYQQIKEKRIKHDSIIEEHKQRYFKNINELKVLVKSLNKDNVVLYEKVSTDLTKFVCGNSECTDIMQDAENKIAVFGTLPVKNRVVTIFSPNVCPHCGKINILSAEEIRRLERAYTFDKDEIFQQLSRFMDNRASGYACSLYGLPENVVESEIPNIAEPIQEHIEQIEDQTNIADCLDAIERYLDMLKFFENQEVSTGELVHESDRMIDDLLSLSTNESRELPNQTDEIPNEVDEIYDELDDELDDVEDNTKDSSGEIQDNNAIDLNQLSEQNKYRRMNLDKTTEFYGTLAKLTSTSVSRDYKELKLNAINSLIYHFESTNYGPYLKASTLMYMEGLYKSRTVIPYLRDLNQGAYEQMLEDLDMAFKGYDIDIEVDEDKDKTIANISKAFDSMNGKIKEFKELRDLHMNKIINRHLELSTLYIGNFSVDSNTITDYIVNPDTARIVDLITDTMIISLVAEDYYYLLFAGLKDKDIARLKDFSGKSDEYFRKTTDYMIKSGIVTGIDKKKLRDNLRNGQSNMLPFPDIDLSSVIRIYPKLQIYLGKDEFNTLLVLEDILDKFDYEVEEEIAIEEHNINKYFIFKELYKYKSTVKETLDKYGRDEIGRLVYYFEDLFTREDIENTKVDFEGDISVIYDKLEDEKFEDYIQLYSNISDKDKDRKFKVVKTVMTEKLRTLAVDLDAIGSVHNAFLDAEYIKNVNIYVFVMNFMFMLNKYLSVEEGLIKLNFGRNTRNILLSTLSKLDLGSKINGNFLKDVFVLSFFYLDSDVNAYIFYERDVEEVDSEGNVREVAIETVDDRIALLRKDPNLLISASEHIPVKEKEIIHEYFGGRE